MTESISVSIKNQTGGNADIVLFYTDGIESLENVQCSVCSLAAGDTSAPLLSVSEPYGYEYWAVSVFVKDGDNAGLYVSENDGPWVECRFDPGSYTFTVDVSSFTVDKGYSATMAQTAPRNDTSAPPISHVFVVMLENRSFDHMLAFSGISGIAAATENDSNTYMIMDAPKATDTASIERVGMFGPQTCNVLVGNPTKMQTDPGHEFPDVVMQLGGEFASFDPANGYPAIDNSGFLASYATSTSEYPYHPPTTDAELDKIMTCFGSADLPILNKLAANFAVCDHWFSSIPGPTWPNRFFLHAASAAGFDHSPNNTQMSQWEVGSGLTFPNGTIFDQLTAQGISFQLYQDYTDNWASYYSADSSWEYASGAVPQAAALSALKSYSFSQLTDLAGDLGAPYPYPYTFIEPHYGDTFGGTYDGGSSQHPMDEVYGGENLLAGIYNAIRSSPYWQSSLLVICYDEHGGFYDHLPPPKCVNPGDLTPAVAQWQNDNQYGFDFTQLGVRVPAVLVSPLIPPGTVSKTVYDHSAVSKLLSQLWGTKTMTARDAKAASLLDDAYIGWLSTPRTDDVSLPSPAAPGSSALPLSQEQKAARLAEQLPESGNEVGTLMVLRKADLEMSDGSPSTREKILEKVRRIRTRGEAQAYAREVLEKMRTWRKLHPPKSALPKGEAEPRRHSG